MRFRPADDLLELTATPVGGESVDVGPVVGGEEGPSFFIAACGAEVVHARIHQVAEPPAPGGSDSSESVEFSCVGPGELWDPSMPNGDDLAVVEAPGSHRVRLEITDLPSGEAVWDFYVWAAEPGPPVSLSRRAPSSWALGIMALPEALDGLAGAARIGQDVDRSDGCRALSGETGTAAASRVCAGPAAQHRPAFYQAHAWTVTPSGEGWYFDQNRMAWYPQNADHPDQLAGRTGMLKTRELRGEPLGRTRPKIVELEVNWLVPSPGYGRAHLDPSGGVALLPEATLQSTSFRRAGSPGVSATEITVEHRHVPAEWVEDLTAWWTFQLAIHALRPHNL